MVMNANLLYIKALVITNQKQQQ